MRRRLLAILRRPPAGRTAILPRRRLAPLDELILTVLSQTPTDTNATVPTPTCARASRLGTTSPTRRSRRLARRHPARRPSGRRSRCALREICDPFAVAHPLDERAFRADALGGPLGPARRTKVWPKTAACVSLVLAGAPFFPVDTHCTASRAGSVSCPRTPMP